MIYNDIHIIMHNHGIIWIYMTYISQSLFTSHGRVPHKKGPHFSRFLQAAKASITVRSEPVTSMRMEGAATSDTWKSTESSTYRRRTWRLLMTQKKSLMFQGFRRSPYVTMKYHDWLVVWTPIYDYSQYRSIGMIIAHIWENKIDVPNHQPVMKWKLKWIAIGKLMIFFVDRTNSSQVPNGLCKLLEVQEGLSTSQTWEQGPSLGWGGVKKPWLTTSESLRSLKTQSESHPGIFFICCASLRLPGSWYWTHMFCSWFAKGQTWQRDTKRSLKKTRGRQ